MSAIEVEHLRKSYGDRVAVRDVSLQVQEGEIFGILGANGAGKTTTVESIEGLRRPDGGRISVLGLDPRGDRAALREVLGVQLQQAELPERLRVGEALELHASFHRAPADVGELSGALGLDDLRDRPFGRLSGGERQRLSIALALVGAPKVAILDELTTGLDPASRRATWSLIERVRDRGTTILLVSHLMEEAERLCDRVAVLDRGRVVALDTPDALADGSGAGERIRFRPRPALDDRVLADLQGIADVRFDRDRVEIVGSGGTLAAVTAALARAGIVAEGLRVEQAGLEDAVLALVEEAS